jgi:retron-type reverse transcriptase
MKRIANIYEKIYSLENLIAADSIAQKGKAGQYGVQQHNRSWAENLFNLRDTLMQKRYRTSAYSTFIIYEPKEREIFRLPYYPDRITHHAIMRVLKPYFMACFTADTYSCIEGKGIHGAQRAVERALKDRTGTQYCLKLDIRKFYPQINHGVLKHLLRRKFKDADLLWLLDEIIDSTEGLPIGNYLSQYFANFYLTYFDHWIKEQQKVKYYFRYADDLVILAEDKPQLHQLLADIRLYFQVELKLEIKDNYQIFPVQARGIDFIGYVFRHTHTRVRKSIKKNCARKIKRSNNPQSKASYNGWFKHGNCIHLKQKLFTA